MGTALRSGANSSDLQQMNRILVLTLLRKLKTTTRVELARMTGLKRATISNIVNDFISRKIVKEVGVTEGEKGRRSIRIALNSGNRRVIAVRLARTYFTVGLFDILGNIHYKETISLNFKDGSNYAMGLIKEKVSEMFHKDGHIFAIGVALPGPYLKTENRIVQISDFPGWESINITDQLQKQFNIPVYVEHDSNASALTEWWYGGNIENLGSNQVLLNVIVGQGVGAGLVQNGIIYRGSHGLAGEIGHTSINIDGPRCACGSRGCLDLYCSSTVLVRNIKQHLPEYPESFLQGQKITLERIGKAVREGDSLAVSEITAMARYLACGIANAIKICDPDIVVIGDELADIGGDCLLNAIKNAIGEHILPKILDHITIKLSQAENPMLAGAMYVAVDNVFNNLQIL